MKLTKLSTITEALPISQLTKDQLSELQTGLSQLGYPVGDIDGLLGPKTRNAWAEFKTDVFQGNPDLIGAESIGALQKKLDEIGDKTIHDFSTKEGTVVSMAETARMTSLR